jgi:hypothetical protein
VSCHLSRSFFRAVAGWDPKTKQGWRPPNQVPPIGGINPTISSWTVWTSEMARDIFSVSENDEENDCLFDNGYICSWGNFDDLFWFKEISMFRETLICWMVGLCDICDICENWCWYIWVHLHNSSFIQSVPDLRWQCEREKLKFVIHQWTLSNDVGWWFGYPLVN